MGFDAVAVRLRFPEGGLDHWLASTADPLGFRGKDPAWGAFTAEARVSFDQYMDFVTQAEPRTPPELEPRTVRELLEAAKDADPYRQLDVTADAFRWQGSFVPRDDKLFCTMQLVATFGAAVLHGAEGALYLLDGAPLGWEHGEESIGLLLKDGEVKSFMPDPDTRAALKKKIHFDEEIPDDLTPPDWLPLS